MRQDEFIWEFLPSGLEGVFEIKDVRKTDQEFHIYLDEIRQKSEEDRWNKSLVGKVIRNIVPYRITRRVAAALIFTCVNVSGWIRQRVKYSVMI